MRVRSSGEGLAGERLALRADEAGPLVLGFSVLAALALDEPLGASVFGVTAFDGEEAFLAEAFRGALVFRAPESADVAEARALVRSVALRGVAFLGAILARY